jgi:hypothetical protein
MGRTSIGSRRMSTRIRRTSSTDDSRRRCRFHNVLPTSAQSRCGASKRLVDSTRRAVTSCSSRRAHFTATLASRMIGLTVDLGPHGSAPHYC